MKIPENFLIRNKSVLRFKSALFASVFVTFAYIPKV